MAKQALAAYRAKRDFSKTKEPSGARAAAPVGAAVLRIQKHAATRLHYDLALNSTVSSSPGP